jgi:hypothetical protein
MHKEFKLEAYFMIQVPFKFVFCPFPHFSVNQRQGCGSACLPGTVLVWGIDAHLMSFCVHTSIIYSKYS